MKKLHILIVDDIFINRLLLHEIVLKLGHYPVEAENGKVALQLIESKPFDLVFMDIEMPVMNGLETTLAIRKHTVENIKTLPIVALTAHNPNIFFQDYHTVGFNNLLTKPYSLSKLTSIIDSLLVSLGNVTLL